MNSSTDLLKRLVDLLPSVNLKARVANPEIKKKPDLVQEIINTGQPAAVKTSVVADFEALKQHVYVHNFTCPSLNLVHAVLPLAGEHVRTVIGANSVVHDYLYTLKFTVSAFDRDDQVTVDYEIHYLCPVRVEFRPAHMIVRFGIIERDWLVPANKNYLIFSAQRNLDESSVLAEVVGSTPPLTVATRANLDQGIKKIWDLNHIDTPYVNFQKASSTSTEAMNAGCFLKDKYPDVYASITAKPLLRTVFERRGAVVNYPKRFTIDPQAGFLMFSLYPDIAASVEHVISQVIAHN